MLLSGWQMISFKHLIRTTRKPNTNKKKRKKRREKQAFPNISRDLKLSNGLNNHSQTLT